MSCVSSDSRDRVEHPIVRNRWQPAYVLLAAEYKRHSLDRFIDPRNTCFPVTVPDRSWC
jgi:hypothetical protein